ncbi:ATP-grasp domain-containing protein [Cohnella pontilimi]|uniref:ATP-grasp domain-containing protein n=1 Tax=Cohnella pontilimi TaxID=2564100 RepID=A0A4U0FE68_9BACL|nr:ATP-grasp domain-containing protein [Cohnella pontilimi]TJY43090.1 ATP-grasp domain-containing protein [Cohnella pontilimi]
MGGKQTLNILIPSAGGVSGTFLIRHLSRHPIEHYVYRIVAADSNADSIAKHISPVFYHIPKSGDPQYENAIYDIIRKERIDIILPVTSYDTPFYAAYKKKLEQLGSKLLVCDLQTHELLHNKEKMYAFMDSIGVSVPQVYTDGEPLLYPVVIKGSESSGSREFHILNDEVDYRYWSTKLREFVMTDFIEGKEFTVDCLFDPSGRLVVHNVRERVKTNGGAVVVTKQAASEEPLRAILSKMESHLTIVGPVNFQYIRDRENRLFLTDFNTRFASGGLPLTIAAGYDIPNLMIRLMLNQNVQVAGKTPERLMMYRFYDELIVREN